MTRKKSNRTLKEIKAMMGEDDEFLRPMVHAVIQEFLEAEMAQAVGAEKGERVEGRLGYRSGYYSRSLVTRVGKLELKLFCDNQNRQQSLYLRGRASTRIRTGDLLITNQVQDGRSINSFAILATRCPEKEIGEKLVSVL